MHIAQAQTKHHTDGSQALTWSASSIRCQGQNRTDLR